MERRDIELYRGREQSLVKHEFLVQYLQAAAFKTFQKVSPIFNYVDAFAGPWNASDSIDFKDTSFGLAIQMLEDVRITLGRNGLPGLKIRFCLCEKRKESVALLREYASRNTKFEIHIFEGEFEENLDAISRVIPNGFTFTFIDPKGWKIRNQKIFAFLEKQERGEFLLNFMSDHINRHAEYSKVTDSFGYFLADPEWASEFATLPSTWSNEKCILYLLKKGMKARKIAHYFPDFSILVPRKERIKMRLILGTNSVSGLEVFRDVQLKVEKLQINIRDEIKEQKSQHESLFDFAQMQINTEGVGGSRNLKLAEDEILQILKKTDQISFGELIPEILENVGIRTTQLKDLLVMLRIKGVVTFELPARAKKPQNETLISMRLKLSP
jgi:three-Cys-motif partner protein